jgi:hypothetical protein
VTRYYKPIRNIPEPRSVFAIGTRVRHTDGVEGQVVGIAAGITGTPVALIAWDDRSSTRCGDDNITIIGTAVPA